MGLQELARRRCAYHTKLVLLLACVELRAGLWMQSFTAGYSGDPDTPRGDFRGPPGPVAPPMPPPRMSGGMEAGALLHGGMSGPIPGQMLVLAPGA